MTKLDMIGPKELSELTSIKVRTLTRLAQEGKIPAVKVGRQWRFIRAEIEKWLKTSAANTRHRILVVDDDEELVVLVSLLLSAMGVEVVAAPGGKEAIEILEKDSIFSLLILDLQMPEVSGPDVLEWMAGHEVDVQTMIITAFPESDLMNKAMRYGHFTVLKKPFDPQAMKKAVEGLLQGVIQLEAG
ncbi:MAG: response regulator [Deltaproteobacteria bacterium]|nr:response regulator [Deltaproteobacteria bacterium]